MPNDILITNNELLKLKPIFLDWLKMNEEYCNAEKDSDCLYWHGEVALVSSLSAAIWRCKGVAVAEYPENKKENKKSYSGRTDLWFSLGESGPRYVAEAKNKWIQLPALRDKLKNEIEKSVNEAHEDLEKNEGINYYENPVDGKLAMVFLVPLIDTTDSGVIHKEFINFLEVVKDITADIKVFFHNPNPIKETNCSYPGVAIICKIMEKVSCPE